MLRTFHYCRKLVLSSKENNSRSALTLTKPTKYESKESNQYYP